MTDVAVRNAAVALSGVAKEFGTGDTKTLALADIDLELPYGELVLLVGPSGCGKTTLISVVAGLLDATRGQTEVLGQNLTRMGGARKVRFRGDNIGFVFQQYNLLPALTAAENACVPLLIAGWSRAKAVAKARELLTAVGLGNRLDSYPNQLSGGQQQRVAIARALVHEPRLLVCDEPTAALDAASGRTVMELIRKVAVQPDRAVIVVTHDSRVYDFGDRIVSMADGRIERIETKNSPGVRAEH
ncbi:putative ABC transporter ATP-binding protein [Gemmata obscuriglobus]|uniref:ABC transporter ATP-binding protein n=1 Tax=Gemmata obscuriglobus TaxID=114 RepID=A0A2Z3GRA2_9BACT|nr:ABC transporter ATP-binding protein [Gemmata obscuriglobus]AWM36879.1 ABC transporter ATP-binding protein [Gemmata obscuriglobus]QEG30448.1 putative ABC transporter ATP-binding protein [Gemmata obscuriglobus]VTS09772.1 abc transporter atp-binding protein : Phosphonate-transporting ATPase OS=Planctomyces brasiliensis (strain ATCC 49424 / DSM 5305 / JCM 21570 / NBRC 103401 / IFAM 1448) GN=Plabr_3617 PE=3 SV=1: ABC_tran [Gemmata obscuriglobus UQM 2246]